MPRSRIRIKSNKDKETGTATAERHLRATQKISGKDKGIMREHESIKMSTVRFGKILPHGKSEILITELKNPFTHLAKDCLALKHLIINTMSNYFTTPHLNQDILL
ncbi:hypothetical protein ATANTOWER_006151 [Ataeniobius toweri]|uniref:Uncharacterized protein n=1 Tax=Ataeniobius toweri TaxID=208326 RepID=A0ABU7AED3_9TELE|nr:hypothetical protein [Ataeniobius toweri]